METTEKIVESYVRHVLGCATITNIQCEGQKEIDILAIHPKTLDRYHIECRVSISGSYSKITDIPFDEEKHRKRQEIAKQRSTMEFYIRHKFGDENVVRMLRNFGFRRGNYTKVLVAWDFREDAEKRARRHKIELWRFTDIICTIVDSVEKDRSYFIDDTMRTLQLYERAVRKREQEEEGAFPIPPGY